MPKKSDKPKDKQSGEKKSQPKGSSSEKDNCNKTEEDFYQMQIECLTEQLERCKQRCDDLQKHNKDFDAQYNALEVDKKKMTKRQAYYVSEKEEKVVGLLDRLEGLQQAADKDREALQLLKQRLREREEELTWENQTLEASLEDCNSQREQLKSKVDSLKKQLANQEEEKKAKIHSMETTAQQEKKRYVKDMENKLTAMEAEMPLLVDKSLPDTTKLAQNENKELRVQIKQAFEESQIVIQDNATLREHTTEHSADVKFLSKMLGDLCSPAKTDASRSSV